MNGIILADIGVWVFIHLFISYSCVKLGTIPFEGDYWLYRERSWEKNGRLYEKLGVKRWKQWAPDASRLFKGGFHKKNLRNMTEEHLRVFLLETKRAELAHWLPIPFAFLFFLWNEIVVGWAMVIYALCLNIPLIIIQRYNRIRLSRILHKQK
ncbi:glycosyl-4,4'-diaponeurosporenoate acyltransferase [Ectobacillus sp. JY-23]|uniref:glycosyl-4,4'-diaponeurosporenoate acyltransferase CrtO family protein n=1 Tax=Ectobacillus sp. JY-23 TaxID=2933872 RepID=UPI001FF1947B|nr:glycosyl-4,4'-diaponeurosporenoate acyltransferase [Ectobacillus sp. JY-23]UOY93110.1 glycosyl-4,4'-diaponeurosporenoate acyltransferase [Ectobacillus sp. JY-23]